MCVRAWYVGGVAFKPDTHPPSWMTDSKKRRCGNSGVEVGLVGMANAMWPMVLAALSMSDLVSAERVCWTLRRAIKSYACGPAGLCSLRDRTVPKRLWGSLADPNWAGPAVRAWSHMNKQTMVSVEYWWHNIRYHVRVSYWFYREERHAFEPLYHDLQLDLRALTWKSLRTIFPNTIHHGVIPAGWIRETGDKENRGTPELDMDFVVVREPVQVPYEYRSGGVANRVTGVFRAVVLPLTFHRVSRPVFQCTDSIVLWIHTDATTTTKDKRRVVLPVSLVHSIWLDVVLMIAFELGSHPEWIDANGRLRFEDKITSIKELCVVRNEDRTFSHLVDTAKCAACTPGAAATDPLV